MKHTFLKICIVFLITPLPASALPNKAKRKKHATIHRTHTNKSSQQCTSAVTYTFSSGRLGDNLIAYLHAKWLAHEYDLPLLYKPFPYSDQLMMHELEKKYDDAETKKFDRQITLDTKHAIEIEKDSSTLYTVPYFPESSSEYDHPNDYIYFEVDWDNEEFRQEIQKMIKPRSALKKLILPEDRITVAVHVRKRTEVFDAPVSFESENPLSGQGFGDHWFPLKFAVDDYYLEQIKRISAFFGHQPLYVYLFTDSPNPVALIELYQKALQLPNIEFDCRRTTNKHDLNVLEDFFALTEFDCLIRVDSNFSLVAAKIGKHKVTVSPKNYYFHPARGYPVIDKVVFTVSNELLPFLSTTDCT